MSNTDQSAAAAELTQLIAERIHALRGRKDFAQIAREARFEPGDIVSMLGTGEAKLSIDNALQLAVALEVDPFRMFRLALGQYWLESMLERVFGRVVSPAE